MLKKNIVVLACALLFPASFAQGNNAFQCQVQINEKNSVFRCGSDIRLKIKTGYPADYQFCGWSLFAYLSSLPSNFCEVTKLPVKKHKAPKWSSVSLKHWFWLPVKMRSQKEIEVTVSTKGYPPGDYQLSVSTIFMAKDKKKELKDIYRQNVFAFTLE